MRRQASERQDLPCSCSEATFRVTFLPVPLWILLQDGQNHLSTAFAGHFAFLHDPSSGSN
jgi:hypothetical protein